MKAILLAAGFGTRLRPITNSIPKCLVNIKGKILLDYWLENIINSGINNILINTHYLSEKVEQHINNSKFAKYSTIIHEKELLGTAGTILSNLNFIEDDDCMLIHADNYSLEDLNHLINAYKKRPKQCLITMMTFRTKKPHLCGIVKVDENNIVTDFYEKIQNPPGNIANGAVYVLSSEFISILKNNFKNAKDFSNDIIPFFTNKINTFETKEIFIDIGTIESYNEANN